MELKHDHSHVGPDDREFISLGYGREDMYALQFDFIYTDQQKAENRAFAEMNGHGAAWAARCDEAAKVKNAHMEPIMAALAKELVCYQYEDRSDVGYLADWDLFFWCNSLRADGAYRGRDYSYFTLTFNKHHDAVRRQQVYNRAMQVLQQFAGDENLSVRVQYTVVMDEVKIARDAEQLAPLLVGRRCAFDANSRSVFRFPDMEVEGRVVEHNGSYYFMKKRARNRGWKLETKDIIAMAANLGLTAQVHLEDREKMEHDHEQAEGSGPVMGSGPLF